VVDDTLYTPAWLALAHSVLTVVICVRVVMRRPATGVALAWMFVVALLPFGGPLAYLLFGERRLNSRRRRRIRERQADYGRLVKEGMGRGFTSVDWSRHGDDAEAMNTLGTRLIGMPTVRGSAAELYCEPDEILKAIARDVRGAERSVLMEFYIWNEGGRADEVLEEVIAAAKRGVTCRILIDHLGARPWWRGKQPARLRAAGVDVRPALRAGVVRSWLDRTDLRLHRKIVVIDGITAWTGSMNMVDPRFFKQEAKVGEWVDAMLRLQGTVVAPLALTLIGDWLLESRDSIGDLIRSSGLGETQPTGTLDIQVVPSGPGETDDGLLQMLLGIVQAARHELILTTPYFVPDDALWRAIRGAAARGVRVHLVVPEKVDSALTRYASRSYYDALLEVGVKIHLFRGGLLHTKSIVADRHLVMFGTVNLDMRSLWLNYEVALFIYGESAGQDIGALQDRYIAQSVELDAAKWRQRPMSQRLLENCLRLVSPIL